MAGQQDQLAVARRGEAVFKLERQCLDRESPVPLWFQIAELFRLAIESGEIPPGQRLENEIEISERLGVSRPTVRQAIQALVQKDLVVRRRGVGTTAAARRIKRPVALTSLYDDLERAGRRPETEVLSLEQRAADAELAATLGVAPDDAVLYIERIRYAEGAPLAFMTNSVPLAILGSPIDKAALEAHGLYGLLRDRGVRPQSAEETIAARTATPEEARLLKVSRNATVLTMVRIAADASGSVVELGRHTYLASRYSFEISLWLK